MQCVNNSEQPFIKFLGVYFDPQLNFKKHVNHIITKLSRSLFFLRSTKHTLNERALKFIYYATFHSHLIYAIHVWSSTTDNILKPIFTKQKAAVRVICNAKYNAHTEPLFKKLGVLPFPMLCQFFKLQFMQRYVQNFLPSSFDNTWITNRIRLANQPHIELRNIDDYHIPFARTNLISLQPLISFPRIWEEFPDEQIKFIRNKPEFNHKLKEHFLSKLSYTVNCNRLICPACQGTV